MAGDVRRQSAANILWRTTFSRFTVAALRLVLGAPPLLLVTGWWNVLLLLLLSLLSLLTDEVIASFEKGCDLIGLGDKISDIILQVVL